MSPRDVHFRIHVVIGLIILATGWFGLLHQGKRALGIGVVAIAAFWIAMALWERLS